MVVCILHCFQEELTNMRSLRLSNETLLELRVAGNWLKRTRLFLKDFNKNTGLKNDEKSDFIYNDESCTRCG